MTAGTNVRRQRRSERRTGAQRTHRLQLSLALGVAAKPHLGTFVVEAKSVVSMTDGEERNDVAMTAIDEEMIVVVVLEEPTTVTASSDGQMIVDRHVEETATETGSRGARTTVVTEGSESLGARTTAVMEVHVEVVVVDNGVGTDLEETMRRRAVPRTGVQSRVRSVQLEAAHLLLVVEIEIAMYLGLVTETVTLLHAAFLAMVPHVLLPESVAFPGTDLVGIHATNARPGLRTASGRMCATRTCESEEVFAFLSSTEERHKSNPIHNCLQYYYSIHAG